MLPPNSSHLSALAALLIVEYYTAAARHECLLFGRGQNRIEGIVLPAVDIGSEMATRSHAEGVMLWISTDPRRRVVGPWEILFWG